MSDRHDRDATTVVQDVGDGLVEQRRDIRWVSECGRQEQFVDSSLVGRGGDVDQVVTGHAKAVTSAEPLDRSGDRPVEVLIESCSGTARQFVVTDVSRASLNRSGETLWPSSDLAKASDEISHTGDDQWPALIGRDAARQGVVHRPTEHVQLVLSFDAGVVLAVHDPDDAPTNVSTTMTCEVLAMLDSGHDLLDRAREELDRHRSKVVAGQLVELGVVEVEGEDLSGRIIDAHDQRMERRPITDCPERIDVSRQSEQLVDVSRRDVGEASLVRRPTVSQRPLCCAHHPVDDIARYRGFVERDASVVQQLAPFKLGARSLVRHADRLDKGDNGPIAGIG